VRLLRLGEQTEQFLRHRNSVRDLHFITSTTPVVGGRIWISTGLWITSAEGY